MKFIIISATMSTAFLILNLAVLYGHNGAFLSKASGFHEFITLNSSTSSSNPNYSYQTTLIMFKSLKTTIITKIYEN